MKKLSLFLIIFLLCFLLTSCGEDSKKMKGFTYNELAEYLSEIDGLLPLGRDEESVLLPCKDNTLHMARITRYVNQYANGAGHSAILLDKIFQIEVPSNGTSVHPIRSISIYHDSFFDKQENYITRSAPDNFAYILRDFNVKCSPEWTEWIDYNIPVIDGHGAKHGSFDVLWYNPQTEEFEHGVYYRQLEDSTELYVVFQETTLFYHVNKSAPVLMSEEMHEYLKTTYKKFRYDHYRKGTVSEFSEWFMCKYLEEIPDVFSDIKDEYVYYPAYGSGGFGNIKDENFDSLSLFIPDLEKLGVNFDALKTYIIKATFPHGGTVEDIYWELIG